MNQIPSRCSRAFREILFPSIGLILIVGSALYSLDPQGVKAAESVAEKTLLLYDSASGAIPTAPLMNFLEVPSGAASPAFADGATVMDTITAGHHVYAGWISGKAAGTGFPLMDRSSGFHVDFTVQLENESHANNHRAGFSVIVLSDDARGIEMAFWQNEIWAQSDDDTGGLFNHGEGVAFATTDGPTAYQLTILGETYTLTAEGETILTGPLRDYSQFAGFPDPYETPNFLFLGDDTTSAGARIRLSLVSITGTEPAIPTEAVTSTSTSSPTPLATDTPALLPSATPVPSPTPANNGFESCPLSGVLVLISAAAVTRKNHRRSIMRRDPARK